MRDPVVMLPGHMCDARLFGPQITCFAASATLHLGQVTEGGSVTEIADNVLRCAPPRFVLAGLSFGGIVAMEICRRQPARVAGLALLDTNHRAETEQAAAERRRRMRRVRSGHLSEVIREEMKPAYLADGPDKSGLLALVMDMALAQGPDVFVRQSRAISGRPDQSQTLRGIRVPCLVLCGREDRLCPVARHEEIAGFVPGARLVVVDQAGHMPTLERPHETNSALQSWMEECGDRRSH